MLHSNVRLETCHVGGNLTLKAELLGYLKNNSEIGNDRTLVVNEKPSLKEQLKAAKTKSLNETKKVTCINHKYKKESKIFK